MKSGAAGMKHVSHQRFENDTNYEKSMVREHRFMLTNDENETKITENPNGTNRYQKQNTLFVLLFRKKQLKGEKT